jgi:hypothetical protein
MPVLWKGDTLIYSYIRAKLGYMQRLIMQVCCELTPSLN